MKTPMQDEWERAASFGQRLAEQVTLLGQMVGHEWQPQAGPLKVGDIVDGFEVVSVYTRAQAIEDGVLKDITKPASFIGFAVPVAMTSTVWHDYVIPSKSDKEQAGQRMAPRLLDLLVALYKKIASGALDALGGETLFEVRLVLASIAKPVTFKAVCGPGDNGEPVLTIMLPEED